MKNSLDNLTTNGWPGRVCFVGLGNPALGDDAFGMCVAQDLLDAGLPALDSALADDAPDSCPPDFGVENGFRPRSPVPENHFVLLAGTTPERQLGRLADGAYDHVVFLDAVDFGGGPGATVLLEAGEIAERFPQVSTHRISLGTLARLIESQGRTRVWLLGVQPESLRPAATLTPTVQRTREMLVALCQTAPTEVAR